MRIVFAGTPTPALVTLQVLVASHHDVVGVITMPDARRGRGRSLHPSAVGDYAEGLGVPVFKPQTVRGNEELYTQVKNLQPEAIVVVAYGALIAEPFLSLPQHGWLNVHYSLLPAWRGAAPVNAAIAHGDAETGISIFRLDAGLDTGDLLTQVSEPIQTTDTVDSLLERLVYIGAQALVDTLDSLEAGTATLTPQPDNLDPATAYAPKLTTADSRIDWTQPAEVIDRLIRSVTPTPGAWTTWAQVGGEPERVKLGPVHLVRSPEAEAPAPLNPGQVSILSGKQPRVWVGTGTDPVELDHVQVPGKKMMAADAWARGVHEQEGIVWQ